MEKKVNYLLKCNKCSMTFSKKDIKSHLYVCATSENESAGDGDNEIEFLESDYELNDSSDEELTDLLTADWPVSEVEQLIDASIQILGKGERIDSPAFWKKLMPVFNKNERWPLFVVKAKLRQLREMFQNDTASFPKKVMTKLKKLSALEKKNSLTVKETVSSTSDIKTDPTDGPSQNSCSGAEDDGDYETVPWTGRQITQLIESYKRHINVMIATSANREKRKIWEKIAAEVEMSGERGCDPYAARMKMMNLKKTWAKHGTGGGNSSWPYFKLMSQVVKLEKSQNRADFDSDPEYVVESSSDEDQSEVSNKRFKGDSVQPEWFTRFRQEARRRHGEKMKIKLKLLEVLENFVDKMNK